MVDYKTEYWKECISQACEDVGIVLSPEQLNSIAIDLATAHEMYSECLYHPENPLKRELEDTHKKLAIEKSKVVCPICQGRGSIHENFGFRSSISTCYKCNGEGKVIP